MNARPEIRERLIEIRLARWCRLAKYPNPTCPASRARRNFWKLYKAHVDTSKRLGYSPTSVYDR
jgi:hypothetical protein